MSAYFPRINLQTCSLDFVDIVKSSQIFLHPFSRSDIETLQYQLTFEIPRIVVNAKYASSGVLLLVQASGKGDYWGEYRNVKAKVYLKAVPDFEEDGLTYLKVETAKLDFSVKGIRMGVENIENGNAVIRKSAHFWFELLNTRADSHAALVGNRN